MLVLIIIIYILLTRCASIVPLEGGERDTIPPQIVWMDPPNFSVGFPINKIHIKYSEFITLTSPKNLIISPSVEKFNIYPIGKNIYIDIQDTLLPTTYKIKPKCVVDFTEKNPDTSLIVFSLGEKIDTSSLLISFEGDYDKNYTGCTYVLLMDSISFPKLLIPPPKNTHYDCIREGEEVRYLPPNKDFFALLFMDRNSNYTWDKELEPVGFAKVKTANFVDTGRLLVKVTFFYDTLPHEFISYVVKYPMALQIGFTVPEPENLFSFSPSPFLIEPLDKYTLLLFYKDTLDFSVLKMANKEDTVLLTPIDMLKKRIYKQIFYVAPFEDTSKLLIKSVYPLDTILHNKIFVRKEGDTSFLNMSVNRITLETSYNSLYPHGIILSPEIAYKEMIVLPGGFQFVGGGSNFDTIVIPLGVFFSKKGALKIYTSNFFGNHIIEISSTYPFFAKNINLCFNRDTSFTLFLPEGEYTIALIEDKNSNCIWDNGYLNSMRLPEKRKVLDKVKIYANTLTEKKISGGN